MDEITEELFLNTFDIAMAGTGLFILLRVVSMMQEGLTLLQIICGG